jgi:hypothetical protein
MEHSRGNGSAVKLETREESCTVPAQEEQP